MMYEKRQLGLLDDTLVGSVYNNYVNLAKEKGNYRTDLSTAGGVNTGGGIHSRGSKGDAAKRWRHNAAMDYYKSQTHDAKPKQSAWQLAQEQINKFPGSDFDQKFAKQELNLLNKDDKKIKITKNISQRYEKRSINNKKDLLNVEGKFCKSKFLFGIK